MNRKLKNARKKMCLTQCETAKLIGISTVAYQNYESERQNPSVKIALKLAEVLHSTVEELFK
nr:MAG TPA: putative transcriptional regulator [Caudoviricetes sp.]